MADSPPSDGAGTDTPAGEPPTGGVKPWSQPLPSVQTPQPQEDVLATLRTTAMRGKLAGFERTHDGFRVDAFGTLYDRTLRATLTPTEGRGSDIRFVGTLNTRWPLLVIGGFLFTLWPGVYFTDSLLATWFSWYRLSIWWTAAWYIPLTLLATPVLWKQFKASEAASWTDAHDVIGKIAGRVDGRVTEAD